MKQLRISLFLFILSLQSRSLWAETANVEISESSTSFQALRIIITIWLITLAGYLIDLTFHIIKKSTTSDPNRYQRHLKSFSITLIIIFVSALSCVIFLK